MRFASLFLAVKPEEQEHTPIPTPWIIEMLAAPATEQYICAKHRIVVAIVVRAQLPSVATWRAKVCLPQIALIGCGWNARPTVWQVGYFTGNTARTAACCAVEAPWLKRWTGAVSNQPRLVPQTPPCISTKTTGRIYPDRFVYQDWYRAGSQYPQRVPARSSVSRVIMDSVLR
jgi:hypothetical protein